MSLSILCVSRLDEYAIPYLKDMERVTQSCDAEFVLVVDRKNLSEVYSNEINPTKAFTVSSKGYIESVLDFCVVLCRTDYILRLDDDERCSREMINWLVEGHYKESDHWKFPRAHLYREHDLFIYNAPLWPDEQTRLSVKAKSGGRCGVHAGSPFGGGKRAPVVIEHHKFLIKTREERLKIAKVYDDFHPGYGTGGMLPFNIPEQVFEEFTLKDLSVATQEAVMLSIND